MSSYYEHERNRQREDHYPARMDADDSSSLAALGIFVAVILMIVGLLYAFGPSPTTFTNTPAAQSTLDPTK